MSEGLDPEVVWPVTRRRARYEIRPAPARLATDSLNALSGSHIGCGLCVIGSARPPPTARTRGYRWPVDPSGSGGGTVCRRPAIEPPAGVPGEPSGGGRPLYDWPERRAATIVFLAFAALAVGTRGTCQGVRPGMAIGILLDATAVRAPLSLCSGGRTGCCLGPSRPWMRFESPFGTHTWHSPRRNLNL